MRAILISTLLTAFLTTAATGQETYYSIFSYRYFIPKVRINDRSVDLQENVLREFYRERSASRDMRWVSENDSVLVAFWQQKGDTVLHILREYSGIEWHESEFDIHLVRYFPSLGSSDPLIIPAGGITRSSVIEAAPEGNRMLLNIVFQLAKRMISQGYQPEDSLYLSVAYHPLVRHGPYRLDNLAMLLAMYTCWNMLGIDSTQDAYESAFWRNNFRGREIFEKYFLDSWVLTPDRTLADWIAAEPPNSQLVTVTRTPRRRRPIGQSGPRTFIEDIPLKGRLGFSVRTGDGGRMVVDKIDVYRLAYACGLRTDDVIRRVDGRVVRNHKQLVEYTLAGLERGGATVEIVREGNPSEVVLQPILLMDEFEDEIIPPGLDSLQQDSTEQDFEEY
ncbi:MAG: hypothetical protein JSW34_00315 [Candidatus Zixiibacteriota bacterium]|nr:MAG: hypothetical protein JSW34_00315 [candidate division Zixibacteria bacterium]